MGRCPCVGQTTVSSPSFEHASQPTISVFITVLGGAWDSMWKAAGQCYHRGTPTPVHLLRTLRSKGRHVGVLETLNVSKMPHS